MLKKARIPLEEAIDRIVSKTSTLQCVTKKIDELYGETLAEDIFALRDQPPFSRSPLDGYAFRGEDSEKASKDSPIKLKVIGKLCAGDAREYEVTAGEAVRIMTGARIPKGANAVIKQEDTNYGEAEVEIYASIKPFQNYCFQGEDYKTGELLIQKETTIDHRAIAVLASNGIAEVKVYRKPYIAVISTGSEVIEPGIPLTLGKIYNSNVFLIQARLRELGIESCRIHINDDVDLVKEELLKQLEFVDGIITTGGVSVGEKDVFNEVLPKVSADIIFQGVDLKPGSPAKYSFIKGKPVLSLSGNPFAAAATFELLARPMIGALMGSKEKECKKTSAILEKGFLKTSPQRRFIRGYFEEGEVTVPESHGSGQIASILGCNCLIDIKKGTECLTKGSIVSVWLL